MRADVVQIAYKVDDVWSAARRWHELTGAGPFFVREHVPIAWATHQGQPAVFDHSTACGQWGPVMIELVQHHRVEPPAMAAAFGSTGINHVAWFVDDLEAERSRLVAAGGTEVMHAHTGSVAFAFFDLGDHTGHLVECYEPMEFLTGFYATVREAARNWDGADPVRLRSYH